jgi:hypothetical protein
VNLFGILRITWLPRTRLTRTPAAIRSPIPFPATYVGHPGPEHHSGPQSRPVSQPPTKPPPQSEPDPGVVTDDVVGGLVALADDLAGLAERLEATSPTARGLALLGRRVEGLLVTCGVQMLRDDGPVLAARHHVIATCPALSDGQNGRIARTVRPGYLLEGRLIRAQHVIAYSSNPSSRELTGTEVTDAR